MSALIHTVYQTLNKKNGKIYIGYHGTTDPYDSYIGSGTRFREAVEKYGESAFMKRVLYKFKTREEALAMEAHLVNTAFITSKSNYNIRHGGSIGDPHPDTQDREKWLQENAWYIHALKARRHSGRYISPSEAIVFYEREMWFHGAPVGHTHRSRIRTKINRVIRDMKNPRGRGKLRKKYNIPGARQGYLRQVAMQTIFCDELDIEPTYKKEVDTIKSAMPS